MISSETIKELRERSGVSVMECKKALEESGGDIDQALKVLDKKFGGMASKKASRETKDGVIDVYLHSNAKIGVMLELHSETDFVARNPAFRELAHNIAMHIAAMDPQYCSIEDVPAEVREAEKAEIAGEVAKMGKPDELVAGIIDGKLQAKLAEVSLMSQPFIKDPDKKVSDLIEEAIGKFGENIKIGRFVRYAIG